MYTHHHACNPPHHAPSSAHSQRACLNGVMAALACLLLFTGCDSLNTSEGIHVGDDPMDHPIEDAFVAREAFSFTTALSEQTLVRLQAYNGRLEIKGVPDATMVVARGERRAGAESLEAAERGLENLAVQMNRLPDEIFIQTLQPEQHDGINYTVDYTITMPEDLALAVKQINGDVQVMHLCENTSVQLINGNIDGDLLLPGNGTLNLTVINGNISLAIPATTSAEVSASVTHGRVDTSNLSFQERQQSRRSLEGTLGSGNGSITLNTVNGDIHVNGRF